MDVIRAYPRRRILFALIRCCTHDVISLKSSAAENVAPDAKMTFSQLSSQELADSQNRRLHRAEKN